MHPSVDSEALIRKPRHQVGSVVHDACGLPSPRGRAEAWSGQTRALLVVRRGSDGQRLLVTGRRPLVVRTAQMEAAVWEDAVPIQNDFPTHEKEKRDRSEP